MRIPDSEIGEIWAKAKLPIVYDLICTLIEERARALYAEDEYDVDWDRHGNRPYTSRYWQKVFSDLRAEYRTKALRQYGIDPATFPKE
jgi:hypothetical protein